MDTPTQPSPEALQELSRVGVKARSAAHELAGLSTETKDAALAAMADALRRDADHVLRANERDVARARANGLSEALVDRLTLTSERLDGIAQGIASVIGLPDPVGGMEDVRRLPNGLEVGRRRVPLGVVVAIYESRPNVTVDVSALCLKSGNAVILRGGSEALHSNIALARTIGSAAEGAGAPAGCIQIVTDPDRALVARLLQMNGVVDVVIPRGGPQLIELVTRTATVPTIETGWGVCHTFVDADADLEMAQSIVINAKTRRPSICNALDTLLVHSAVAPRFLPTVGQALRGRGVELHVDDGLRSRLPGDLETVPLGRDDLDTEWLSLRMSIALVDDLDGALRHIRSHGSGHSEAIVTQSHTNARRFVQEVDAAAVYVNASTQFTDGGEFGLGAEVGISTQKLHARGPMGLREMTTYKWVVLGDGHVRPV